MRKNTCNLSTPPTSKHANNVEESEPKTTFDVVILIMGNMFAALLVRGVVLGLLLLGMYILLIVGMNSRIAVVNSSRKGREGRHIDRKALKTLVAAAEVHGARLGKRVRTRKAAREVLKTVRSQY